MLKTSIVLFILMIHLCLIAQTGQVVQKDSSSIRMIDSIEQANMVEERLKLMDAYLTGNTPLGFLNFDYRKFLNYNEYEGIRLGLGLATNQKLSSFFSLGGYVSYGFHDQKWKDGATFQIFPSWLSDNKLTFLYHNDVAEVGGYHFLDEYMLNQSEIYRSIDIDRMLYIQEGEVNLSFRILRDLKILVYLNNAIKILPDYIFTPAASNYNGTESTFHFTETGMCLKLAFHEKFVKIPNGRLISEGTEFPMIWFNIRRGVTVLGGNFSYTKYEIKVMKTLTSQALGQTNIVIAAGTTSGDIPITNLYNGHASYAPFTIDAENTFATMRMDEFFATDFASLFFKQNFGKTWFHHPFFHPYFSIASNAGIGQLTNAAHQAPVAYNSYNKGYYESGFLANDLLISGSLINLGFGIFYRYGPYAFESTSENFCYRLTINFNIK